MIYRTLELHAINYSPQFFLDLRNFGGNLRVVECIVKSTAKRGLVHDKRRSFILKSYKN